MLLLRDDDIDARRRATASGAPLAPLYESLAAELEPVLGNPPFVPAEKALLTRAGGRCELHGTMLEFDPRSPHEHRCGVCGRVHTGELHDRAWIMPYQLWLAERAVQGALFHLLRGDPRHAAFARDTLLTYARQYLAYPNADNVLGPSRLFFSTYLESIWLLQICLAAQLLERGGDTGTADTIRDRVVEPARAMIAGYDEGMSNRQVWNNAALLASAALCGDHRALERLVHGPSGLEAHLSSAMLADGTWYEGENYHQFALRGLWYGVNLVESRGGTLPSALAARFQRAFAAPFVTALPDFTMPSRKDSQYAVSLRQWRMAELAELGFARGPDPVLGGALLRCYEEGHERRDTGRARSTADVERNLPSSALVRADLGWRALLHAMPELPPLASVQSRSALLEGQGYAVFRRDGGIYVGFEFGQSGGGHGHPDRLNLTLYRDDVRCLDDLGTGSYLERSLHWYRSTLAHNAPLVNGKSQPIRDGTLLAWDEREGLGWIVAEFRIPEGDVRLERAVVVAPDYLIDELTWNAVDDVRVELPWHLDVPAASETASVHLDGGSGLEDGFAHVTDAKSLPDTAVIRSRNAPHLLFSTVSDVPVSLFTASAPGQPPTTSRRFVLARMHGRTGIARSVISWTGEMQISHGIGSERQTDAPPREAAFSVQCRTGERHVHRRDQKGWHVELFSGDARSSIDLSGVRTPAPRPPRAAEPHRIPMRIHRSRRSGEWLTDLSSADREHLLIYQMGEAHYRRSEESWESAGSPHATVALTFVTDELVILARVNAGQPIFTPADAANPFDNEHADTLAAGLQLYARTASGAGAWMIVPESGRAEARIRAIQQAGLPHPRGHWRAAPDGYEARIALPLPDAGRGEFPLEIDLLVNETTLGRQRRRGQLVLSGARGEFAYLRGDRHDWTRLIPMVIVP